MLARTRLKLRNAEKSINFMQEQHSKILEGLHQEIDKLQKKNARLTFQLTMSEGNSSGKDLQLQDALITTGSELARVKLSLSKEQQKAALLHNQVDDLLSKHSEEITAKDDLLKKLCIELDSKADLVVLLTQQIYRLRAKLKQDTESGNSQSNVCSCPHCYMHSKISPEGRVLLNTSTQGTGQVRKIIPLKKSDGRHHTQSVPASLASVDDLQHTPSKVPTRTLVPTPPPSTPPLSASGRRRVLMKRASTTDVKSLALTADSQCESASSCDFKTAQDSHLLKRTPQTPWNQEGNMRIRRSHHDESHFLCSRVSEDEKDHAAKTVHRDIPAILPPIVEPPMLDFSEDNSKNLYASHVVEVEKLSDVSLLQQHKANYLAKFSGLSSAPPSSLRVYHRATRSRQRPISRVAVEEDPENPEPDGMLMVNGNDDKTSESRARWAKGTPALDSVK